MRSSSWMTSRSFSSSPGSTRGCWTMSRSTARAVGKWGWGTLDQNEVTSRSVLAFMMPPTPSMASLTCRAVGQRLVPLKGMCSRKWEMPDVSADSYLEPAPMLITVETDLLWGMVEVSTRSPLSNTVRWYIKPLPEGSLPK